MEKSHWEINYTVTTKYVILFQNQYSIFSFTIFMLNSLEKTCKLKMDSCQFLDLINFLNNTHDLTLPNSTLYRPYIQVLSLKFQLLSICLCFYQKYWYDCKSSRMGTQICSPEPSIQLWYCFGKGLLWILQNPCCKIVTCWNVYKFSLDHHLNICQIYLRSQTILIVWGISIHGFNH